MTGLSLATLLFLLFLQQSRSPSLPVVPSSPSPAIRNRMAERRGTVAVPMQSALSMDSAVDYSVDVTDHLDRTTWFRPDMNR